ncbi:hypothetical protein [Spirosoma migulaei]
MEPQRNSPTETLIAEMEQAINRLKHISAQYHPIPISLENSALRKRLYDQFEQERVQLFMAYGQDKSFQLEALNPSLFLEFNQYLIDHVCGINDIHQSPTFMEYLFSEKP